MVVRIKPPTSVAADSLEHGAPTFYRRTPGRAYGVLIWEFVWPDKTPKVEGWR